jgi:dipeptide transport system permease protein
MTAMAMLRRLARHGGVRFGAVVVTTFALVALLAPWVAPHDPEAIALRSNLQGPSWRHPFGTDSLGRDVLSRTIWGARISLTIGFVSVGLAMLGGVPLGALSAWAGGWTDRLLMRTADVLISFPTLLLAIVVITIFGPGLGHAMLAIGIAQVPLYARLTRAAVLRVKVQHFVEAARASGAGEWRIVARHVLPNCLPPLLVQTTLLFATAILSAAYLGFLGLGAQPPTPEWGTMLAEAREFITSAWWVVTMPGIAILVTVLAINLIGDGLRDTLDPRLKRS